jgi:hypothetical protein
MAAARIAISCISVSIVREIAGGTPALQTCAKFLGENRAGSRNF